MKSAGAGKLKFSWRGSSPLYEIPRYSPSERSNSMRRSDTSRVHLGAGHLYSPSDWSCRQFKISEADEAARRIRGEAGRAVAVQFACIEESPGSAEQDAG